MTQELAGPSTQIARGQLPSSSIVFGMREGMCRVACFESAFVTLHRVQGLGHGAWGATCLK